MKVTYLGHSCFLIEVKGKRLLFDPFISGNPIAKDIVNIDSIRAEYVLISHGHADHMVDAEQILKKNNAIVLSNNEIVTLLEERGIAKGHPFNLGGKHTFDFGSVRYVGAAHSSVLSDGTYAGNPGGFVIKTDEGSFYFAGDTGLTYDMKLIGDYYHVDFALLPLGDNFTMDVDDAIIASDFLKCNKIVGMHYNTWPIISIDTKGAILKFNRAGKELILFEIGETKEMC